MVAPAPAIPERESPRQVIDRFFARLTADQLCLGALTAILALTCWRLLAGGTTAGQDAITQFYPWYSYLGERLREFGIPSWNPSQFSGAPFASDPQSGWSYLPAL